MADESGTAGEPVAASEGATPPPRREGLFAKLASNPWIVAVSLLVNLTSIPLSVYLFLESRSSPDLRMLLHPIRSTIAATGVDDGFEVAYQGRKVREVSLLRVALWNDGPGAVRATQVLTPVSLSLPSGCEILRASASSQTREVVRFSVEVVRTAGAADRAVVAWHILERGDGAVIEVLYAGPATASVSVSGVVEGQRSVSLEPSLIRVKSQQEQYESARSSGSIALAVTLGVFLLVLSLGSFKDARNDWRLMSKERRALWWFGTAMKAGVLGLLAWQFAEAVRKVRAVTPFDF